MRISLTETNRPDRIVAAVRNSEATADIPKGTPLILNLSKAAQPTTANDGAAIGYEDGLQVVLPATATATPTYMFPYGVATDIIKNNQLGASQIFGVIAYALVLRATRAASTDSWTSSNSASSVGGYFLSIDTVNNCFATLTPSSISLANASSIVTSGAIDIQRTPPIAMLLDSFASFSASASATSDTRTAMINGYRAFIRMM